MDGNDAMKLVLPAAAFAVGVGSTKMPGLAVVVVTWMAGNALVGNMSEVSLLLYFWPRSET